MAALATKPTRIQSRSEQIFFERPIGPDWHKRLQDELVAEYAGHPSRPLQEIEAGEAPPEPRPEQPPPPKPRSERKRDTRIRVRVHARRAGERQKPEPKYVFRVVARTESCTECNKPFGVDRQRHWFNENCCSLCSDALASASAPVAQEAGR